jgi:uncharacterized iron-regulated membrane protein
MVAGRTDRLRVWRNVHTWTSLVCTLFLLLLCLTGLPLIFHDELDELLEASIPVPDLPVNTPLVSLDEIVAVARARAPESIPLVLFWDHDNAHVVKMMVATDDGTDPKRRRIFAFDERTAQFLVEPEQGYSFTEFMLRLHKELFVGLPGELFLGAMGLFFTAAIVSGAVIYAPFMRRLPFGTVRRGRSRAAYWLDLHNLLGIAILCWLTVVALTGVMNTLNKPLFDLWRAQVMPKLLAPHMGKPKLETPASAAQAAATAARILPEMKVTSIVFPGTRFATPRHYVIWTKGKTPLTAQLFTPVLIDAETLVVAQADPLPWYMRVLELSRPLHFGDYGGWPLKILWTLFDLAAIVLLGSGVYLWLRKRRSDANEALDIAPTLADPRP